MATDDVEPAQFYTGLVADLYAPLRGSAPNPDRYEAFIRRHGEPALELGCGHGDPLLTLRSRGLDVDGLDSSADMLRLAETAAADVGLAVELHHQTIQDMDLGSRFRSIFLAGPTFNLLPDDAAARAGLASIARHLVPGGRALVPLFVPGPVPESALGDLRQESTGDDTVIRCGPIAVERDDAARTQHMVLRYERDHGGSTERVDRTWLLHWYSPPQFAALVHGTGLEIESVTDWHGNPADDDATGFEVVLRRSVPA